MIQKPKGMRDFLPEDVVKIRELEQRFIRLSEQYGFREIRYPMFEKTELFERGVGETTDIVTKEMFRVISAANLEKYKTGDYDLKKEGLTLRPEGTASVMRSFIENKLYAQAMPMKLSYLGSNFRNERPQAGRFREFTQFGVETLGSDDAFCDAEVIDLAATMIRQSGVPSIDTLINSVGCPVCRPVFHEALRDFLSDKLERLCGDCQSRFDKNPLRIIDCKVPADQALIQGHPVMLDYLCKDCRDHFDQLQHYLDALGVDFEIDPNIVRGLDYYVKTAFEIKHDGLGAQSSICGGGRYDGLVENLGGPDIPGVGFGMGMDRLLMAADLYREEADRPERQGSFLIGFGPQAKLELVELLAELRERGLIAELEVNDRSMKAAMKQADRMNARYAIIVGEDELAQGKIAVRDLERSEQQLMTAEEFLRRVEE